MAGTILVGYDGSPSAAVALDWALRRAEATGLAVDVLFVADTSWDSEAFTATPLLEKKGEVVLATAAFHADSKAPHVQVSSRVLPGNPVHVLCEQAEATGAELLVVGSYRKDLYERLTTSAVSVRVAAAAKVTVAVIPDLPPAHRSGVVVGVDGSDASAALLDAAMAEAARLGEPVSVVTAWTLPPLTQPDFTPDSELYDALEERARDVVADAVSQVRDRRAADAAPGSGPDPVITTSVVLDAPAPALITAASEAALLVIGSHGRRGLSRFLLGSVSHDVLIHAPCPLLVLRVGDRR
ncbi:universal stress protein [Herbiconiux moechotypicola]|uniref:UspA domain-containing protein n=1 Tax=Herbiconiux moechotypicola TaxID=637393 RepID=A0ABN3D8Y3_9MICO|nr:universal stress protein [Herbiconiux moechotypicola]MCS5728278.1 universal stress protein [Herbiconiux moechotypicola]